MTFQNGERSDPGGPGFPHIFQCRVGHSGKVGSDGVMSPTGVTAWTVMGGKGAHHCLLCGLQPHIRPQTHIVTEEAEGGG